MRRAFDLGITHFDLANNYGPPYGSAETNFGSILRSDFGGLRDELIISTKAGWDMWPGPYGDHGSRKYLLASLDQSLGRLGLDYVDIFYHHRFDPDTPLEETMGALDAAVRQGKALYVGISSYSDRAHEGGGHDPALAGHAAAHPPAVVLDVQPLDRGQVARRPGRGGRRVHRLLPAGPGAADRALPARNPRGVAGVGELLLSRDMLSEENLGRVRALAKIAAGRGQKVSQLALAWALRDPRVTSLVIGASSVAQLEENVVALDNLKFSDEELKEIDVYAVDGGIDLWRGPATS